MILSKETALFQKDAIANLASSSKYITKINDSGIKIHPYDDTVGEADANHFLSLTAEGMQIYNGGTSNSNVIAKFNTINNNPAVTIGFTSTGKYNTHITQDGLYLRTGTDSYAILNANGLVLSKGGIKAGDYINNPTKFIYLSTEDYTDSPTITIGDNNANWRQIIGNKFGVKNDGTLYASNAHVEGAITATSLIIGNGSNVYDGEAAINITGYTIEILQNSNHDLVTDPTENIWIYPVLYHNNNVVTVSDGRAFKWYKDNDTENPIIGNQIDGGMLGVYGSTYRVTYTFEDGAVVDGASPVQQNITVSDATHITEISNNGIKVHHSTNNNNYIQIDSNGLEVIQNGTSVAKYGTTARIGASAGSRFLMNSDSLQAYNSSGTKYFEVTSSGLNWNNGTTTNYITYDASNGLQIASASPSTATRKIQILSNGINIKNDSNNYLSITSSKIALFKNNIEKLQLTDSLLRLGDSNNYVSIDSDSLDIYNNQTRLATFYSEGAEIGENSTTAKIGFNQGRGSITARDLTGSTTGQYDLTFGIDDTGWGSNYYALVTGLKARKVMSNTDESVSQLDVMANNNGASFNMLASHPQYNSSGDDIGSAWPSISGTTENTGLNGVLNLKVFSTVAGTIESEGIEVRTNINSARTSKTTYINFTGNYITFNGTTIHSSDKRLKTHINYLGKEAIDFISALHPAYFSLKEQKTTGFYAQEVEYIDPWNCFVNEDINGYKTLNYIGLIAPLVTYCQHLEKRITELETQLEGGTN